MAVKRKRVKKVTPPNTKGRIVILQATFALIIAIMVVRLYQVQIIQHDFHARRVLPLGKSSPALTVGPRRGGIYDRNGRELAVSIILESVGGDPRVLQKQNDATIHQICDILQMSAIDMKSKMDSKQHFLWMKRKVTPQVAARLKILEEKEDKGIEFRQENQRYYPGKELSAQVLGFTGRENQGQEGAERFFDELLSENPKGKTIDLTRFIGPKTDSQDPETVSQGSETGTQGQKDDSQWLLKTNKACNILLTIDRVIQYQTEKELYAACTASKADAGTAIVMDVTNGEILAMASCPPFNPNSISKYYADFHRTRPNTTDPETFAKYLAGLYRNRCITDAFEPGSVFKIFLAAAALEAGTIEPNKIVFCENGVFQIGRRKNSRYTQA